MLSQRQIKILYILWPSPSKDDLILKKINEMTIKMGDDWKVFALKGNLDSKSLSKLNLTCPSEFHPVNLFGSHKNILSRIIYHISCITKGVKLVKKEDIDVITQHDGHIEYGIIAFIISRLTHRKCLIRVNEDTLIPLIYFLRSSNNQLLRNPIIQNLASILYRRIESFFFNHVDWIITHGPMDYQKIRDLTNKITFVPLWVDIEKFTRFDEDKRLKIKSQFNIAQNTKIILFVGRLHPEKGIRTLFKAVNLLPDKNFQVLMVYSYYQYKAEFEQLAKNLGISEKTSFLGYFNNEELPKLYNIADVYVLPSLREQWSNSIMESMACRTPVIATNVGANPYLIVDDKTGFLFSPNDSKLLSEKIRLILENPSLANRLAENALIEVKKYDKDAVGESYKRVISLLVRSK